MNFASLRRLTGPLVYEVRVMTSHFGGLLGPEYTIGVGDQYFRVGELTKTLLEKGTPLDELDLMEIDPDEEEEQF